MNKIDRRKKYFLVVDVETAGSLACPLIYDIGFAICDKQGNVYEERSYVIQEIFDNQGYMQYAYYAKKIPQYIEDLKTGKRTKVAFDFARLEMLRLMRMYNVQTICAYNLAFDRRALQKTMEIIHNKKDIKFLTKEFANIEQLCIWSFACEVIYTQPTFQRVAVEQQWITESGKNLKTSAEIGWRYISGEYDFIESHTGLEDVQIEVKIMAKCFAQHKKHESGVIAHPWRIPNSIPR